MHPSGGRSGTFERKTHAKAALDKVLAEISAGKWHDPDLGSDNFREYADDWLAMRDLKPRAAEHYRRLLDAELLPAFGDRRVDEITVDAVNRWYRQFGAHRPTMRAHAYSLLKSIMRAAVDGRKVDFNPCTIRGGGTAKTAKTVTIATPVQVDTMAANVPERFSAMILLGAWAALRFGELAALRRKDVDLDRAVVHIRRAVVVVDHHQEEGDPKSRAGVREVAFHRGLVDPLRAHLAAYTQPGPTVCCSLAPTAPGCARRLGGMSSTPPGTLPAGKATSTT